MNEGNTYLLIFLKNIIKTDCELNYKKKWYVD